MRRVLGEPEGRSPIGTRADEITVDELLDLEARQLERQEKKELLAVVWERGGEAA